MAIRVTSVLKKRLGDLLVDLGIISREQLQQALEVQRQTGGKLGRILIQLGFVTEEVLLYFLGKQAGVSYVSLADYGKIPEEIVRIVPESIARYQTIIPIAKNEKILTIAMSDPFNIFAIDDLRLTTGYDIKVVIAPEKEIKNAIELYYGTKETIEQAIKEIEKGTGEGAIEVVKTAEEKKEVISLEAAAEEVPVVKIVNLLLTGAVKAKASDIHIEPYEKSLRVRYRLDGVLHEQPSPPKKLQDAITSRIKIMSNLDIAERRLPQDGRIKIKTLGREVDLRVSVLPTAFGEKIVIRLLDSSALCLDLTKLGFEPEALSIYKKNISLPHGIILITGPTGSGKSTTLYSTLSTLNYPDRNIMTIEDPVEYVLEGINQIQARPEIGLTFAAGLRSFLRQDPNIIMVGEIRDTETAEIAINAALTGHLVFSTLHTNDAPGAITRLNNMGIEPFLTASTVSLVVAQRLVRIICKECKETYAVPFDFLANLGVKPEQVNYAKEIYLSRGKGCDNCSNTGYRRRLGIYELIEINDEVRELILERASTHLLKQAARKTGMMNLREAALRKVLNGITTIEEMMRVTITDTE
jgi:type IV pilus assembly protein PilB